MPASVPRVTHLMDGPLTSTFPSTLPPANGQSAGSQHRSTFLRLHSCPFPGLKPSYRPHHSHQQLEHGLSPLSQQNRLTTFFPLRKLLVLALSQEGMGSCLFLPPTFDPVKHLQSPHHAPGAVVYHPAHVSLFPSRASTLDSHSCRLRMRHGSGGLPWFCSTASHLPCAPAIRAQSWSSGGQHTMYSLLGRTTFVTVRGRRPRILLRLQL